MRTSRSHHVSSSAAFLSHNAPRRGGGRGIKTSPALCRGTLCILPPGPRLFGPVPPSPSHRGRGRGPSSPPHPPSLPTRPEVPPPPPIGGQRAGRAPHWLCRLPLGAAAAGGGGEGSGAALRQQQRRRRHHGELRPPPSLPGADGAGMSSAAGRGEAGAAGEGGRPPPFIFWGVLGWGR